MAKVLRGKLHRKTKGLKGHHQENETNGSASTTASLRTDKNGGGGCTCVGWIRGFLMICGFFSILWNISHFHYNLLPSFDQVEAGLALKEAFLDFKQKTNRKKTDNNLRGADTGTEKAQHQPPDNNNENDNNLDPGNPGIPDMVNQNNKDNFHPVNPDQHGRAFTLPPRAVTYVTPWEEFKGIPKPKVWEIAASLQDQFDKSAFGQRLDSWKEHQQHIRQERYHRRVRQAVHEADKGGTNSTLRIIPHFQDTPIFPRHLSSDLMVLVMADNQCPLVLSGVSSNGGMINATDRLLLTLTDALKTQFAHVVAYLPHYYSSETVDNCHNSLYQAIVKSFPIQLQTGQLQVVTSPQLQAQPSAKQQQSYRFAYNGLDFAYATELGHQFSDLMLFLQAGTRLTPEWWIQYVPVEVPPPPEGVPPANETTTTTGPPKLEAKQITSNRDYAYEILLAYEARHRLDGDGLNHELCYMNFAINAQPPASSNLTFNYGHWGNPTGTLFESSGLLRLSLTLRSFLPYGKFPVSKLLHKYCSELLWAADTLNGPLALFRHHAKNRGIEESKLAVGLQPDLQPLDKTTTYPYLIPKSTEVPGWVTVDAGMVGPHPTSEINPLWETEDTHDEKNWLTFVVPTAWRHTAKGDVGGNTYVVECLQQLSDAVKQYFVGEYRATILVLVSGRSQRDINQHRDGLQAKFEDQIQTGIIQLVDAPIDQYPTLHGLDAHYKDTESRARWRSKQNLDISAALFAAKGYGKYIMTIEDDSAFRATSMLKQIKKQITNLHHMANPQDAVDRSPQIFINGQDKTKVDISYTEKEEPAVIEFGHREVWSQVRFSFGFSGVLIHDEDAFVFGMLHFLLYKERPCDLLFQISDNVRNGESRDHFLRNNLKARSIMHRGKVSTLKGKVFTTEQMTAEEEG
ncbi:Alpha-1,3-mannosyl-glycoprotein 4-beta-N-acetylglucosaminyltransferase A [Seminavis robusta]|uniref:Alpha-1,3-mannosyl-glycoprotein 4-beta-N-acetylglucosaminyltransferase A n=1 Tax=Seminavis robusta TaxID=568900 RepID=A0A9N8H8E4_9STRA|nr:Alpha-1,3-mannosyl-glycoprotein 4-beta-N-acetylglucosaminyltransferase A [Seminavis robusta]|eukprot:Sro237_g095300.1 Alpha-1,3-mannosyl-glycoprotein 4-beta-N-acetylglucosaminyltransferase A (911) ;mRNA; f:45370-48200